MTNKKAYITTAIPYVNGTPHIGNALDYLIADIWARYQKQNSKEVRFQVGTDEHGNKIAAKAAEAGLTPQAYTDKMYGNFEALMRKIGAEFTDFIRTTNPHHEKAVQYIWQKLQPYIYKGTYQGWYCQGCESFVTDKEANANNGTCPDHHTQYQLLSEENYYLKTSAFTDALRTAMEKRKFEIIPEFRKKEFLELIKDGLKDVSISRPKKNSAGGCLCRVTRVKSCMSGLMRLRIILRYSAILKTKTGKIIGQLMCKLLGKIFCVFMQGFGRRCYWDLGLLFPKNY